MTHRERELAAIRHQPVDRIPVDSQKIEITDSIAGYLSMPVEDVHERLGLDGVNIGLEYLHQQDDILFCEWGVPRYDDWGGHRAYTLANAGTAAEVERYPWPDPSDYNFEKAKRQTAEAVKRYAVRGPRCSGFFDPACLLFGLEEALVKMVLKPEVFDSATNFRDVADFTYGGN